MGDKIREAFRVLKVIVIFFNVIVGVLGSYGRVLRKGVI